MITILTNKKEIATKYPTIGKAFQLIDDDSGCEFATNPYKFTRLCDTYNLPQVDGELGYLFDSELETLCTGEESDQRCIARENNCELAHEFLNCYFNLP